MASVKRNAESPATNPMAMVRIKPERPLVALRPESRVVPPPSLVERIPTDCAKQPLLTFSLGKGVKKKMPGLNLRPGRGLRPTDTSNVLRG